MKLGDRGNKYRKITKDQRQRIIQLIVCQKMTIKAAAEALGLGASTARMILRKYQKTGTFFEPKSHKNQAQIAQPLALEPQLFSDPDFALKHKNEQNENVQKTPLSNPIIHNTQYFMLYPYSTSAMNPSVDINQVYFYPFL